MVSKTKHAEKQSKTREDYEKAKDLMSNHLVVAASISVLDEEKSDIRARLTKLLRRVTSEYGYKGTDVSLGKEGLTVSVGGIKINANITEGVRVVNDRALVGYFVSEKLFNMLSPNLTPLMEEVRSYKPDSIDRFHHLEKKNWLRRAPELQVREVGKKKKQ